MVVSLTMITQCYHNDKVNINTLSKQDMITVSENVKGIGKATAAKLVAHQPYADISDVKNINGIGDKTAKIISTHFCTYDTWRFEYLMLIQIIGVLIGVVSIVIFVCKTYREMVYKEHEEHLAEQQRKAIIDSINKVGKCNLNDNKDKIK